MSCSFIYTYAYTHVHTTQALIEEKEIYDNNVSCTCIAGFMVQPSEEGNSTTVPDSEELSRRSDYPYQGSDFNSAPIYHEFSQQYFDVRNSAGRLHGRRLLQANVTMPVEAGPGGVCVDIDEW